MCPRAGPIESYSEWDWLARLGYEPQNHSSKVQATMAEGETDPCQDMMDVLDSQKESLKEGTYLQLANALGRLHKRTRRPPAPRSAPARDPVLGMTRDQRWASLCRMLCLHPEQERALRVWLQPGRHSDDHRCVAVCAGTGERCKELSGGRAPFLCSRNNRGRAGRDRARLVMHTVMLRESHSMAAPLPSGWEAVKSRSMHGEVYYANRSTGETTWVRPAAPRPMEVADLIGALIAQAEGRG